MIKATPSQLCFYCPRCKKLIKPFSGKILQDYISGKISEESAKYRLKVVHYRHEHTDYEKRLEEIKMQIGPSIEWGAKLWSWNDNVKERLWLFINVCKKDGVNREALEKADQEYKKLEQFKKRREDLKRIFNREAKRLMLEDALETLEVFKDVVGLDEAKRTVVNSFLKPLLFSKGEKGYIKEGLLLYGPPGTGKTIFALSLKKLVRKLKKLHERNIIDVEIIFERVSPSDFLYPLIGESEKKIREFFEKVKKELWARRAYIIFFDEVEGLFSKRESWEPSYTRSTIAELLQSVSEINNVLLIGCTNKPWDLDPAALRPGRFGTKIYVPPPSIEEIEQLFKLFLKNEKIKETIDFKRLAQSLYASRKYDNFYSGADIENICRTAKRIAEEHGREITLEDLQKAIESSSPSISLTQLEEYEKFKEAYP